MGYHDRRKRKTEKSLSEALVSLSKAKWYKSITVTELCIEADINRCTFYAHYRDMEDFLDSFEDRLADDIIAIFSRYEHDTDGRSILKHFFEYLADNSEKLFILFGNKTASGTGLAKIYEGIRKYTLPAWKEESYLDDDRLDLAFSYMMNGTFALIGTWYESGFAVPRETVEDMLENMVKYGLYTYIYVK